jgi:hypothetical protein
VSKFIEKFEAIIVSVRLLLEGRIQKAGFRARGSGHIAPEGYRDLMSTPECAEAVLRVRDPLRNMLLGATTYQFKFGRSEEIRVHRLRTRSDKYYRDAVAIFRVASFKDRSDSDEAEKFLITMAHLHPRLRRRCRNKKRGGGKRMDYSAVYLAIYGGTSEQPFFVREPLLSNVLYPCRRDLMRSDKLEIIEPYNEDLNRLVDLTMERRLIGEYNQFSAAFEVYELSMRQICREIYALILEDLEKVEELRCAKNRLFALQSLLIERGIELRNTILDAFIETLDKFGFLQSFGDALRARLSEAGSLGWPPTLTA